MTCENCEKLRAERYSLAEQLAQAREAAIHAQELADTSREFAIASRILAALAQPSAPASPEKCPCCGMVADLTKCEVCAICQKAFLDVKPTLDAEPEKCECEFRAREGGIRNSLIVNGICQRCGKPAKKGD